MDKKSKNYSKAYGIWVLAITVVVCQYGYYSGIQMFIRNFFNASIGNFAAFSTVFWHISDLINGKAWIACIKVRTLAYKSFFHINCQIIYVPLLVFKTERK